MKIKDFRVFLFIPNIIDYCRLWLLYVAFTHYIVDADAVKFSVLYLASYGLDAIDGPIARYLKQTSKLGIYLDMVADRLSSCILLYLSGSMLMKKSSEIQTQTMEDSIRKLGLICAAVIFFFCLVFVEIIAHTVVMVYSELVHVHQKLLNTDSNQIISLYLTNRAVLTMSCVMFELTGLGVLLEAPLLYYLVTTPLFVFRVIANLLRFHSVIIHYLESKKQSD